MDVVFANLAWSLYWAYLGVHPDRCPKGILYTTGVDFGNALTPLSGVFFLVLWILRADLEWIVKRLWLSDYRSNDCILCEAGNGPDMPAWTDFREAAPWMRTLWTKLTWQHAYPGRHRLFKSLPGLSVVSYVPDPLHTKYIGTDGYFLGGVLRYLTHHLLTNDVDANLKQIEHDMREAYRSLGVSNGKFERLQHTAIQGSSAKLPYLKGTGKQIAQMTRAMIVVFGKYEGAARAINGISKQRIQQAHRFIATTLKHSARIDEILLSNRASYVLSKPTSRAFRTHCFAYAQMTTVLIDIFHPRIPVFHCTLKLHYLAHLALIADFMCPCLASCAEGEDMMKIVKKRLIS